MLFKRKRKGWNQRQESAWSSPVERWQNRRVTNTSDTQITRTWRDCLCVSIFRCKYLLFLVKQSRFDLNLIYKVEGFFNELQENRPSARTSEISEGDWPAKGSKCSNGNTGKMADHTTSWRLVYVQCQKLFHRLYRFLKLFMCDIYVYAWTIGFECHISKACICHLSLTSQTVYLNVLTWFGFGHIT